MEECSRGRVACFRDFAEQVKGGFSARPALFRMPLGYFIRQAPFGRIAGRIATVLKVATMHKVRNGQAGRPTAVLPAPSQTVAPPLKVGQRCPKENEDVKVWMPAAFAVGDFPRPDHAHNAHAGEQRYGLFPAPEKRKGLGLARQQVGKLMAPVVAVCEGQQQDFAAACFMHGHGRFKLAPTPFADLRGTYRAMPDAAACF